MRFSAPLALLASLIVALVAITPAVAATPKHKTVRCHLQVNGKKVWTKCPTPKAGKTGAAGSNGHDGSNGSNGSNGLDGKAGVNGLNGLNGAKGDTGDAVMTGAYYSVAYYDVGDTNGGAIATVACSHATDTAISGGVSIDDYTKVVPVGQSFPGRMDWTTNTPKPNRLDGWIVQFASQNGSAPLKVKVYALCVPGLSVPMTQTYQQSVDG